MDMIDTKFKLINIILIDLVNDLMIVIYMKSRTKLFFKTKNINLYYYIKDETLKVFVARW